MLSLQIASFILFLFVALHASPLQPRNVVSDQRAAVVSSAVTNGPQAVEPTLITTDNTTTGEDSTEQNSTSPSPSRSLVQEIVIHHYHDNELFPINSNATVANSSDEDSALSTPSSADHQGQHIVVHAHGDGDIVQAVDGVTVGSVIHREIDAIYVKPVDEALADVHKDDVTRSVEDVDVVSKDDVKRSVEDVDAVPKDDVKRSVVDKHAVPKDDVKRNVVASTVDDMTVAESGMVFRPVFRYRQQSRSRINRNVRRRWRRPRWAFN